MKASIQKLLAMVLLGGLTSILFWCSEPPVKDQKISAQSLVRIVSLKGSVTETLVALGLEKNIVGVDASSLWPASMQALPKVGHRSEISSEGILSLNPTLIVGTRNELKPETIQQLESTGIPVVLFDQEFTTDGTKSLISGLAEKLSMSDKAPELIQEIDQQLGKVKKLETRPKILFIYARGAGTLLVGGEDTPVDEIITMAGGENAATGFTNYKPLTNEALVKANPDIILMFKTGMESLDGDGGVWAIPGIENTEAGKNRRLITMSGPLLTGFGPRLGEAVVALNQAIESSLSSQAITYAP